MKKISGLLMLLLMFFLVSAFAAAEPYGVSKGDALILNSLGTKISVEEEVAGITGASEIIANRGEPPSHRLGPFYTTIIPYTGIEVALIEADYNFTANITNNRDAGGVRALAWGCRS